jgi:hypothetical protein
VEMLCFSAGRCRGYLHAKALGTGGELLTYIWLLMSHMGMESLPERLQREELRGQGGNNSPIPLPSEVCISSNASPTPEDRTSTAPSSSKAPTVADPFTSDVPHGASAWTSEIRLADEDDMV